MPSKDPRQRLQDIIEAIDHISLFRSGHGSAASLRTDIKSYRAIERCIEIISEAAAKLGPEAEQLCPDIPWPDVRGMGNWLRHGYDAVDLDIIWKTAVHDLPVSRHACERALSHDA